MSRNLIPMGDLEERSYDHIFSRYTHPVLEEFIQGIIDEHRDALPHEAYQKLVREFFLYGLLRSSGEEFRGHMGRGFTVNPAERSGEFCTNNGVLAVSDFDGEVYMRGGESWHGYFDFGTGGLPEGVEGTLLESGYKSGDIFVPHSNGEIYTDPKKEQLFCALVHFSREVRTLRGEPTSGLIIKDLSEPEPEAPYSRRDPSLPRIELEDAMLIPGNRNRVISVRRNRD